MCKNQGAITRKRTALVLALFLASVGAGKAQNASQLRAQSKLFFGPLPARMPGSQNDTPERIALGKKLYFEPRLSVNDSQSCDTCHALDGRGGGVDHEPAPVGALGQRGHRNSPTTLNAGFHLAQFWDGREPDLPAQAKRPILNPVEMAMPDPAAVVKKLAATDEYPRRFAQAFPDSPEITYDHVAEAIAAFERTLITHDRFDEFMNGNLDALSPEELKGLEVFFAIGCFTCHRGPAMGGTMYQRIGLIHPYENPRDPGRYAITGDKSDLYKFKVPSLRNIALTHPYFHDGSQRTLKQAVRKMAWLQLGRELSDEETGRIAAFFQSLTGIPPAGSEAQTAPPRHERP